jgi:hypothetical protein
MSPSHFLDTHILLYSTVVIRQVEGVTMINPFR